MKYSVDFNRNNTEGQMAQVERRALYESVLEKKPRNILEIGTWKGGGSTYYLSAAAYEYDGHLFTIEPDYPFYSYAINLYSTQFTELRERICFLFGKSHDIIPHLLSLGNFDYAFLDGEENTEQTLKEFILLTPCIKPGFTLALHDIHTSIKMKKLIPILQSDPSWIKRCEITHTSTGFAIYEKS